MAEDLGDVLVGVFEVFLDVLLVDSLFEHFLVLWVHWVFGELLEFFLLFVELFHALAVLLLHVGCKPFDITIEYKCSNLRLSVTQTSKSLRVVLDLPVHLFSRAHVRLNRFLPELESLLFFILIEIFNHIGDIELWLRLLSGLLHGCWQECHIDELSFFNSLLVQPVLVFKRFAIEQKSQSFGGN